VTKELELGFELPTRTKLITQEVMSHYANMMKSALAGRLLTAVENIHTDEEFAKGQGMSHSLADGLIFSGMFSAILTEFFGEGYLRGGKLSTKFIRPVWPNDEVTCKAVITEKVVEDSRVRYNLELSCHNQKGETVVVGTASAIAH